MHIRQSLFRSLVAIPLIVGVLSAQSAPRTSFGILVGGTAAKLSDVDVGAADLFNGLSTIKYRYGFQVGAYVNRSFNSMFSLQPELHYVQKGTKLEIGGTSPGSLTIDLSYVEVPVLLRADFGSASWRPFVTAGPTFSFRVGCKATAKTSGATLSVDCKEFDDDGTIADPFETTDFGATVGAGLVGSLGGQRALVQLRYGRGFKTVIKDVAASGGSTQAPKNAVLSLVFGFGN